MKKITTYQILTIVTTLITITVNALANALPFNGQGTGEISDRFAIYFVPAGYVFAIWGIIYLGLIGFTIYQALPAQRNNPLLEKFAPAYWIGNLANAAWMFLWHYEFFYLALVAMLIILGSLLFIYIQISKSAASLDNIQKWFLVMPFSIYLGWISVATIANISQILFLIGWGGWGIAASIWAMIMISVAACLGLLMRWRENDLAYVLVLVWALVGIALKQANTPPVAYTAWTAAGILFLWLITVPLLHRSSRPVRK